MRLGEDDHEASLARDDKEVSLAEIYDVSRK